MGYTDAKNDGIRISGVWQERFFHPHCYLCGVEIATYNYKSGVKYKCASCKKIVASAQKEQRRIENYEPGERQIANAVKKIGGHTDIRRYKKAILKVADEVHNGSIYDSVPEVMVAIELTRGEIAYRPQVRLGAYTADFLLDDYKVVLEIDGVLYHTNKTREHEELRDGLIILALGVEWQVIRITDEMVNENITRLIPAIDKVLKKRKQLRKADGSLPKWYTDRETS